MAPFGLSRAFSKSDKDKHKPSPLGGSVTQRRDDETYITTTTVPTNTGTGWKRVLKRKKPAPPLPGSRSNEPLVPSQDNYLIGGPIHAQDHMYTTRTPGQRHQHLLEESPPHSHQSLRSHHTTQGKKQRPSSDSSSSSSRSSSSSGYRQAPTVLPGDSASNVHIYHHETGDGHHQMMHDHHGHHQPMVGIVEEQSDIEYVRPESPVITPLRTPALGQPIVIGPSGSLPGIPHHLQEQVVVVEEGSQRHHTGGSFAPSHHHGRHHQDHHHQGNHPHVVRLEDDHHEHHSRLRPVEIRDVNGNPQEVQEIILDGSGVQEFPMPAHGNVIFIVDEHTKLDVKDPETGEFVPLEQYYANLAARRPPPQERYVVINGDASNIIVEDADGRILHRGNSVRTIPGSPDSSHGGASYVNLHHTGPHHGHHSSSTDHHGEGRHTRDANGGVRVYFADPYSRKHRKHGEGRPDMSRSNSSQSNGTTSSNGSGSSRSSRSRGSNVTYSDRGVQVVHVDTTPEISMMGSAKHAPSSRGSAVGMDDDGRDLARPLHSMPVIREERGDNGSRISRTPSVSSKMPQPWGGSAASPLTAPAPVLVTSHPILGHGGPVSPPAPHPSNQSLGMPHSMEPGYFPSSTRTTTKSLPRSHHTGASASHKREVSFAEHGDGVVINAYQQSADPHGTPQSSVYKMPSPHPHVHSPPQSPLEPPYALPNDGFPTPAPGWTGNSPHPSHAGFPPATGGFAQQNGGWTDSPPNSARSRLIDAALGGPPSPSHSRNNSPVQSLRPQPTGQEEAAVPGGFPPASVARSASGASRRSARSAKSYAPSFRSAMGQPMPAVPPLPVHVTGEMDPGSRRASPSAEAQWQHHHRTGGSHPPVEIGSLTGQVENIVHGYAGADQAVASHLTGASGIVATMRPNSTFSLATLGEREHKGHKDKKIKKKGKPTSPTPSTTTTSPVRATFGMSGPPLIGATIPEHATGDPSYFSYDPHTGAQAGHMQMPSPGNDHGTQVVSLDSPAQRSISLHHPPSSDQGFANFSHMQGAGSPHMSQGHQSPNSMHHSFRSASPGGNWPQEHHTGGQPADPLFAQNGSRPTSPLVRSSSRASHASHLAPPNQHQPPSQQTSPRAPSISPIPEFPNMSSRAPSLKPSSKFSVSSPRGTKPPSHRSGASPQYSFVQNPLPGSPHRAGASPIPPMVTDLVNNLTITASTDHAKADGLGISGIKENELPAHSSPVIVANMTGSSPKVAPSRFGAFEMGEEEEAKEEEEEGGEPSREPSPPPAQGKKGAKGKKNQEKEAPKAAAGKKTGKGKKK